MAATTFNTLYLSKKDYEIIEEQTVLSSGKLHLSLLLLVNFFHLITKIPFPKSTSVLFSVPWGIDCFCIQTDYYIWELLISIFTKLLFGTSISSGGVI